MANVRGLDVLLIILVRWAAADKVWRRDTIFIARVLELTVAEVEIEYRDRVSILICHNEVLSGVVKLEVTRSFTSGVEMADSLQFTAFGSLAPYFVHGDGLVSTVGHYYESA